MPRPHIRKLRLVGCDAVAFLLQTAVLHRFSPGWGRPDLICLLAAFLALEALPPVALWGGLGLGLLRDLGSAGPMGGSALAVLPAVAVLLVLRDRLYRGPAVDVALALIFLLTFSVLEGGSAMIHSPGTRAPMLLRVTLGQSLFSAALAFPIFFLLQRTVLIGKRGGAFAE